VDGLSIGPGNLAGKGVYATREFTSGAVVVAFELEPLTRDQFRTLVPGEELFVHSYGGRRWLYPPPARWVNHADQPSCYQDFARFCDVALRPIKVGEPITIDATQETSRELSTFLDAYVEAQQGDDYEGLCGLLAADAVLWDRGRVTRGAEHVASALAAKPVQALFEPEWHVGTGRWEALCSAELDSKHGAGHASVFLRVLEGDWRVVYDHRG
jgi:hypothetical protein